MNTIEVLRAARELISDSARWTKGTSARDINGQKCEISRGVSWCALGAADKFSAGRGAAGAALHAALASMPGNELRMVTSYNDSHTHAEVLALFDRAIAAEEAR